MMTGFIGSDLRREGCWSGPPHDDLNKNRYIESFRSSCKNRGSWNGKRMLSPSRSFGSALSLGGQHARHSVSPTRPRPTRAHHRALAVPPPAGGLLGPLHRAGAAVELGAGGRPSAVAGGGGRRAALVPVAGELAPGAVRHPARLRRAAPPPAGPAARLPAGGLAPPPAPAPLPQGHRPPPRPLLQAPPYPAAPRPKGAAAGRHPLCPRLRYRVTAAQGTVLRRGRHPLRP